MADTTTETVLRVNTLGARRVITVVHEDVGPHADNRLGSVALVYDGPTDICRHGWYRSVCPDRCAYQLPRDAETPFHRA